MKNDTKSKKSKEAKRVKYWALLEVNLIKTERGLKNNFTISYAVNDLTSIQDMNLVAEMESNKKHRYIAVKISQIIYDDFVKETTEFGGHSINLIQGSSFGGDGYYDWVVELNPKKFTKTKSIEVIKYWKSLIGSVPYSEEEGLKYVIK